MLTEVGKMFLKTIYPIMSGDIEADAFDASFRTYEKSFQIDELKSIDEDEWEARQQLAVRLAKVEIGNQIENKKELEIQTEKYLEDETFLKLISTFEKEIAFKCAVCYEAGYLAGKKETQNQ